MSTCRILLQLIAHHPTAKFDNILRYCKQAEANMMFDRKIQSHLPNGNITEKDKAC